jgi:2'-5' RNA ligase
VMDSTHTPANQTVEPGAIVFIKDPYETGYTDEEIRLLLTGRADEVGRPKAALIAAADVQTGAMIAFIPREEDAQRLAISDGESTQQLHTTSIYLGDAVDIPNDVRAEIIETMVDCANGCEPIVANVFGFSILNPDGEEPCLVANVGGQELWDAQQMIIEISDEMDWASPDQHQPWLAHITLIYSADPRVSLTDDVLSRTGPIIYDRIRVAFAGVITDIPLCSAILVTFSTVIRMLRDRRGRFYDPLRARLRERLSCIVACTASRSRMCHLTAMCSTSDRRHSRVVSLCGTGSQTSMRRRRVGCSARIARPCTTG